jgi:hypothetical protein
MLQATVNTLFNFSYDTDNETRTVVKEVVSQRKLISVVQQVFRNNKHAAMSLSDMQVCSLCNTMHHRPTQR